MYPSRKPNRLPHYDYTRNGAYFVTICTKDRQPCLWDASYKNCNPDTTQGFAEDGSPVPQGNVLSRIGTIVLQKIAEVSVHFPSVTVDRFAIMPDHVHLLLFLHRNPGTGNPSPTMGNVVGWLKYQTTKNVNAENGTAVAGLWQRSYYDHVIRDHQDYMEKMQYIDNNLIRRMNHIPKGM